MEDNIYETANDGGKAHNHADQAMSVDSTRSARRKVSKAMGSDMFAVQKYITNAVQKIFPDVYSYDIMLLCGVAMYLARTGKMTAKRDDVLRHMGYRVPGMLRKYSRRLEGLADKCYLLRVRYNAGAIDRRGHGFALSELGGAVLERVDLEYDNARKWVKNNRRLEANILYLDQASKVLKKSQEILMTPKLVERLRGIKI